MLDKRLMQLRKSNNKTQQDIAKVIGVTRPAYTAYERGTRTPDYDILKTLANYYDVTVDYLLGNSNQPKLTEKDEKDIAKRMEKMKEDLISGGDGDGLSFMGEPLSEEATESLLEALEHAERIATLTNKKFIPKKHRK